MSFKALCHVCLRSNVTCMINGTTGMPECNKCIKKEIIKLPDMTCYCKECQIHNPIQTNNEPITIDIPMDVTVEG